jgi:serine/threonine-protein kinase
LVGEILGSYRIISQLGAGAMGEVYLAEHRHLKRKAALKLLARSLVGRPELLERFFMEARATSAIAHPGIVQIFDCEVDAEGRPYIVMEYLSGETLAAHLARTGPFPPVTAARLAQAMASALGAAHAKGIVHRDFKPENVFVDVDASESVKLVDFGIAKLAGELRAEQVHQTLTGSLMGTPLYMSPEQCRDSGKIDFRTDLYSLGCVLFEMLTGQPPFAHEALGDLLVAHLTQLPRDVRALNPAVPPLLAELCASLLQKDPAARPAHMGEVAQTLGQIVARATTEPQVSPPPSVARPASATGARVKTTFGEATGQVVVSEGDEASAKGERSRRTIVVGALAAAAVAGLVAMGVARMGPAARTSSRNGPSLGARVGGAEFGVHEGGLAAGAVAPLAVAPPAADGATGALPRGKTAPSRPATTIDEASKSRAGAHGKRTSASARSAGGALAGNPNPAATPAPAPGMAPAPTPGRAGVQGSSQAIPDAPRPAELAGAWEGAWNDPGKQQQGRLYLQIAGDGAASGWMFNGAAQESFRLAGRVTPAGTLDLSCRCPVDRTFSAHGSVRVGGAGELEGQLALSSKAGVFGQSHLALRRTTPRP